MYLLHSPDLLLRRGSNWERKGFDLGKEGVRLSRNCFGLGKEEGSDYLTLVGFIRNCFDFTFSLEAQTYNKNLGSE